MRTNQFLTSFSLCAFLLAMAGCTDESQLTGTDAGETDTPVSLTIRTTMTDFAGLPEPDVSSPASTRATNNGNTTTFVPGDKIGIYAVREENGEIFGNIETSASPTKWAATASQANGKPPTEWSSTISPKSCTLPITLTKRSFPPQL